MSKFLKLVKTICFSIIISTLYACGAPEEDGGGGTPSQVSMQSECLSSLGTSSGITISWDAPSEYTNNTYLDTSEIQYYKIHLGTESGVYSEILTLHDSTANSCSIPTSGTGKFYIAMSVVLNDGRISELSNEIIRSL